MSFVRLLLAFALTIAIPLQGLAAATCMCKLRQSQESTAAHAMAGYAAAALSHLVTAASSKHGGTTGVASASNQDAPAAVHVGGPVESGKAHGACPKCSMSCCQAAVSTPGVPAIEFANVHIDKVEFPPALFASWAEPVPHKPPRS